MKSTIELSTIQNLLVFARQGAGNGKNAGEPASACDGVFTKTTNAVQVPPIRIWRLLHSPPSSIPPAALNQMQTEDVVPQVFRGDTVEKRSR
jgi:hypothetical protein